MSNIIIPSLIVALSGNEQAITPDTYIYSYKRNIHLFDEINSVTASNVISQLTALDDISHQDITLMINSPGGSVADGFAIIDAMSSLKSDIRTVCTGVAASMAAVVLSAGTEGKRLITPMAEVMIHQPLGGIQGQASEISKMCEHITKVKDNIAEFLSEKTSNSKEKLIADMDRDYWMDAREAIKYGLVDKILKGENS